MFTLSLDRKCMRFLWILFPKLTKIDIRKGGVISESFSLWLKSAKLGAKSRPWASSLYADSAQGCGLAPIIGDLSQSEKLSEIKPPLKITATDSAILCTNANAFKYEKFLPKWYLLF